MAEKLPYVVNYGMITKTLEKKKASLFAHKSQNGGGIWQNHHEPIASWRGREAGCQAAEAFVRLNRDVAIKLPRL